MSKGFCHFCDGPPLSTHHHHRGLEPRTVQHGGGAQNHRFCTILSEISKNHHRNLRCLALVSFKTHHKMNIFLSEPSKHVIK